MNLKGLVLAVDLPFNWIIGIGFDSVAAVVSN